MILYFIMHYISYCIVLYCIVLFYTILYYIISYDIVLYWILLYYTILYCIILYYFMYIILHNIILYYIILDFIILYCIILYYIILCIFVSNNDSKVMTDLDRLPSSCVIFCKAAQLAQISESACVRALIMRSAKRQFVGRWLVFLLTLFRACFLLIVLWKP